jgi:enamine deaminase RidA (YjgF/YER057c/UK114 family)
MSMAEFLNPPTLSKPASRFSQGVVICGPGRRLFISGQVAMKADGTLVEGLEAQTQQVFDNIEALLGAAGMGVTDLVKLVIYCTVPGGSGVVRDIRNQRLGSHAPASTFVQVAGLANPAYLVEIEGEAFVQA